jgi:hypothetical protein
MIAPFCYINYARRRKLFLDVLQEYLHSHQEYLQPHFAVPLSGLGVKKFGVFTTKFDPSNCASFPPIIRLSLQQALEMFVDNIPKIEFMLTNWLDCSMKMA